ncbi:EamA family transporter [Noviherbaspirillum agri]
MRNADIVRLLGLAAIWGASFLFMRIVAPVLGALWTAEVRVALAGIAMLLVMAATRRAMRFRENWRQYLIVGTFNSAVPFALFSYAALTLPAGYSAILNATSPLWGALVGAAVLGESMTARKLAGLGCGIAGVAFLVRLGPAQFSPQLLLAALACVSAALCYAIAGAYSKKQSGGIAPPMMATGSQIGAALVLLPLLPTSPIRGEVTPFVMLIAALLALLCSAVAYLIYFRLIADLGPTRALTVTFLIPLFAMLWGALFLQEAITVNTLIGCAMVVLATWLVVFQPQVVQAEKA